MSISNSVELPNRYVSNNPVSKLNSQVLYENHQRRLSEIRNSATLVNSKELNRLKISSSLEKYREKSKPTLFDQAYEERKRQNSLLFNKLKGIYERQSKNNLNKIQQRKIVSNIISEKKRTNERILEGNLILIDNLRSGSRTAKEMKANIRQQIKQYLAKRAHVRRKILPKEQKKYRKELNLCKIRAKSLTTTDTLNTLLSSHLYN